MPSPKQRPPNWKYWWPLSLWKVLAIFFLVNLMMQVVAAGLREGLGLTWISGNAAAASAAVVGFLVIWRLSQKARAEKDNAAS